MTSTFDHFPLPKVTLRTQLRAIVITAQAGWRRYWRYPLNAVSQVFQPIIWLTPIFFLGQAFSQNGTQTGFAAYSGTGDYMSFILLGSALSSFISTVFWGMGYSLKSEMDAGVLESNWLAPVPRPFMLIGRTLHSMLITALTSISTLLVAGLLFGFRVATANLLPALATTLPMLIGLYGFGFAFAALVLLMKDANTLVDVGNYLVDLLSGSQFPVNVLPKWLLPVSMAIPLTYGFDAFRSFLLGTYTLLPLHYEIILLLVFMVVMLVGGLWVLDKLERHVRTTGTLSSH